MNKEDLIALGIEDDVAKSVMALHGKTVTNLNAKVATAESERDNAKQELATNQTELNALKESAQGNDELTQKLADLQTKFDEAKTNSEKQLSEQQKDFAIKLALNEAQVLDNDIVLGQLDKETIKVVDGKLQGFEEQLNGLKENKAFLFQNSDPNPDPEPNPKPQIVPGGNPSGSQSGGKTIVQKIQERLGE